MHQPSAAEPDDLEQLPGHHIRRLQQIAVALFLEETAAFAVTPVQFAALATVRKLPGVDQRTLAATIGFDTSTLGGVLDRLEARGLVVREVAADDRRVKRLQITPAGTRLLGDITAPMLRAQERILAPLEEGERERFMDMLRRLVHANNAASRAPSGVATRRSAPGAIQRDDADAPPRRRPRTSTITKTTVARTSGSR